MIRRLSGS